MNKTAEIYVNYGGFDWDISTYINGNFDEYYYQVFKYKKDALKEARIIKKALFNVDGVDQVTLIVDLDGGIERDTFTYNQN